MRCLSQTGGVRGMLRAEPPAANAIALAWLGQAGFAIRGAGMLIVIDPYLSDSLAEKYRGKEFAHTRMMPPPIEPSELTGVDVLLCTHRHTDHMDPGTLPGIAQASPQCRFVVPAAEREAAIERGVPREGIVAVNSGAAISGTGASPVHLEEAHGRGAHATASPVEIWPIPAAHEQLQINSRGEHHFLGYIIRLGEITLYHSGDCVPYPGLLDHLRGRGIEIALLPVNGRDEFRRSRGVPGNFTFGEAMALCREAGIPHLVPHHFGMFAFNTVDLSSCGTVPEVAKWYLFDASDTPTGASS